MAGTFVYDPPASWDDFTDPKYVSQRTAFRTHWHSFVLDQFSTNISGLGSPCLFFSEAQTEIPSSVAVIPIPWDGFPRRLRLKLAGRTQLMTESDALQPLGNTGLNFRPQDEYLEWLALKDGDGKVKKFVFTAEAREYWSHLAKDQPDLVVDLYRQMTDDPTIKFDSLRVTRGFSLRGDESYQRGDYNPWNKYNTQLGCVHLTHPANSLGAEINLAAVATLQKVDANGQRVSEPHRLACCSSFGVPDRSSDPTIGQAVNLSVRGGISATLANPVGLYIGSINLSLATGPNGEPTQDWWRITRGNSVRGLRAEFSPPAGAQFGLEDISIGNEKLRYGGQIAELIKMVLFARVFNLGINEPTAATCGNKCCVAKGITNPERALLDQVGATDPCPSNERDAFPELTMPNRVPVIATRRGLPDAKHID